jgi:hypothetical protein
MPRIQQYELYKNRHHERTRAVTTARRHDKTMEILIYELPLIPKATEGSYPNKPDGSAS